MQPLYLELDNQTIQKKIDHALDILKNCRLCPRNCGVNRQAGETGYCGVGRYAYIASYNLHFGEESPIVGKKGSGTIFFAGCNLGCIFCQNYQVSHFPGEFIRVIPKQLAAIMLELQKSGAHNINLVTPTHVVPQILESLPEAIEQGLDIPLVYNCGGYESLDTLKMLEGVVDIYMPDVKFADPEIAHKYCNARDYPEKAKLALKEMHRQTNNLVTDADKIAKRGLLVRHLIMPDNIASTDSWLEFIAKEISTHTCLNLMDQYHPAGEIRDYPELNRPITAKEYLRAVQLAEEYGLTPL